MRVMTAAGLMLLCASVGAQTIPASESAKHIGERTTVCGRIASEHTATSSRGTPTFINLDKPYPDQVFTVLIWGGDRAGVGAIPSSGTLCATGVIHLVPRDTGDRDQGF
jgi:micrococcal nuclease